MTRLSRFPRLLALPVAVALAGCGAQAATSWERVGDDLVVRPTADGAADVRLQVASVGMIRVPADLGGDFGRSARQKSADLDCDGPHDEAVHAHVQLTADA